MKIYNQRFENSLIEIFLLCILLLSLILFVLFLEGYIEKLYCSVGIVFLLKILFDTISKRIIERNTLKIDNKFIKYLIFNKNFVKIQYNNREQITLNYYEIDSCELLIEANRTYADSMYWSLYHPVVINKCLIRFKDKNGHTYQITKCFIGQCFIYRLIKYLKLIKIFTFNFIGDGEYAQTKITQRINKILYN